MILKQLLYKLLGVKNYLMVVSRLFFIAYASGWLKRNKTFDCHYFIKKLIHKGDHVIDIGANLGYYSRLFAQLVGHKGSVTSVEPVTLFREILTRNTKKYKNITILPYALGTEDDKPVIMGIPRSNKYLRHGLTRVLDHEETAPFEFTFTEKMFTPAKLFGALKQCDYIKCDVEGYEIHIIPQLGFLLEQYHPIIQIEIEPKNRPEIFAFLSTFGYSAYYLRDEQLIPIITPIHHQGNSTIREVEVLPTIQSEQYGDFFFVPPGRLKRITPYLSK